jgi:hypothetical protein
MKRNLLVVATTSSILALAVPSLALAQGRHHHHSTRHASTHKRGHRAHVLTFGGRHSGSPSSAAPTTGPSSDEPAGTVVSFTEGVLTIELTSDKSLIKGKVTEKTELECQPAASAGSDEEQGGGDDQDQSEGGMAHSSDVGDDQGEEQDEEPCTTAALKPGAIVLRAELLIGGGGAVWEEIKLQK